MLRDGVYLLPANDDHRQKLTTLSCEVVESGGQAEVLWVTPHSPTQEGAFRARFDRGGEYTALLAEMDKLDPAFPDPNHLRKSLRALRRRLVEVTGIDFFPGQSRQEIETRLSELEAALNARLSPGEPGRTQGALEQLRADQFQGRLWTTRNDLGVDRLASAWLIRRFIDPGAGFVWFSPTEGPPPEAIGFDFDGARFTHVGARVTFETLLASFGLEENPALRPLARMVRHLDTGEGSAEEAAGFLALLRGMKARLNNDDAFLEEGSRILDDYHLSFSNPEEQP
ncbi:MAG: chromate resistance protein [Magnetococcales bacterium]|nr:chromate resistance protein [Magnetococcales bacterium]MBF0348700.1 chromate resistance protein [Magnetococcales bacterium]MBF0631771.1 chromate resistance protein [Magnetococcales bacterium]